MACRAINLLRTTAITPHVQRYVSTMSCKKLDKESAKDLVNSVDSFLFDCDGMYSTTVVIFTLSHFSENTNSVFLCFLFLLFVYR